MIIMQILPVKKKKEDPMNRMFWSAISLIGFVLWASVSLAEDVKYRTHIKQVFDAKCLGCHGSSTPEYEQFGVEKDKWVKQGLGMRMDSFRQLVNFVVWPNTGAVMRRLDDGKNTKDEKPGNMYQYLGDTEEERQKNLSVFKRWVGLWTLKRLPELSKEEILQLNNIRETY
jgi:hypothetical protein